MVPWCRGAITYCYWAQHRINLQQKDTKTLQQKWQQKDTAAEMTWVFLKCGDQGIKSFDSEDFKHTLFCHKIAFVTIYVFLLKNMCFFSYFPFFVPL